MDAFIANAWTKTDHNKDGKLLVGEFKNFVHAYGFPVDHQKVFDQHDKNKNKSLDQAEFAAAVKDLFAQFPVVLKCIEDFKMIDADQSHTLSKAEVTAFVKKTQPAANVEDVFKQLDKNGDGKITFKEFVAYSLKK